MDELTENVEFTEDDLFADYEPEQTSESENEATESTETPAEPTSETEETAPAGEAEFLRVRFNGEERGLSEEEARTFAQKGMNYDRFYEPIERLARLNNMSVGDYVNQLNETQTAYEVSKEIDVLREDPKYADLNEDVLEEIAEARVRQSIGERDANYATEQHREEDAQKQMFQEQIDKFMEEYPEYRTKGPDALDPKVFEYVQKGYTLLEAYNKFQRESVNQKQADLAAKASQKNEENRKKSLGNTSNAGSAEADPFLAGLE